MLMSHHDSKPVPQLHQQLLEKEVAKVKKGDLEFVLQQYERHNLHLNETGTNLTDTMFRQLDEIFCLLHREKPISEREQKVAIAAIRYFVDEHDHIIDSHKSGLADDALVVQAAVNELKEALEDVEC